MRVLGLCRFSYPALGGFQRVHDSMEEREAYLYDRARMAGRFRHFEALTLPSIKAQSDPEFTFLILVGESLPRPYLDQLCALTADVPQIKIVALPPMRMRKAAQKVLVDELAAGDTGQDSIQFRLDDDDAVALEFVERLRLITARAAPLRAESRCFAIEFNKGYSVALSQNGILAEQVTASFWACGLAVWLRGGDNKTVMNFPHHKMHHQIPMLIQPGREMFIRAKHDDNDSAKNYRTGELLPPDAEQLRRFRNRFNVDEAQIRQIFARAPAAPDKA